MKKLTPLCFLLFFSSSAIATNLSTDVSAESIDKAYPIAYSHLDTKKLAPKVLLTKAINYFHANKKKIKNKKFIVVIDYKQKSTSERFYLIDMITGHVEKYLVAHGAGSDPARTGFAKEFSNIDNSHMTSLGFFITAETYYGRHGYSLKLDGQSSTNSNARARAIVIHGAEYVSQGSVGRSWGCPALSIRDNEEVIDKIKGGALIYAGPQ